jgi:hypothetical protein
VLDSAVEAILEPLRPLVEHVVRWLLILAHVVPLIAVRGSSAQEIQRAVALGVVVVKAQKTTLLFLELLH